MGFNVGLDCHTGFSWNAGFRGTKAVFNMGFSLKLKKYESINFWIMNNAGLEALAAMPLS
jgi:hypothetical protein